MENDNFEKDLYKGIPFLHKALGWLLATWMLAPFWFLVVMGSDLSIYVIFGVFFAFVAICCYYLARSASSRWEAIKILAIPMFFFLIGFSGMIFGYRVLNEFGAQGVCFFAPAWLSEILRYKAYNRKIHVAAVYFLIQHGLTVLVAIQAFWSRGFLNPNFFFPSLLLWYFSYPIGFVILQRKLVLFAVRNERKVRS